MLRAAATKLTDSVPAPPSLLRRTRCPNLSWQLARSGGETCCRGEVKGQATAARAAQYIVFFDKDGAANVRGASGFLRQELTLVTALLRVELNAADSAALFVSLSSPTVSAEVGNASPYAFVKTVLCEANVCEKGTLLYPTGFLAPHVKLQGGATIVAIYAELTMFCDSRAVNGGLGGTQIVDSPSLAEEEQQDAEQTTPTSAQLKSNFGSRSGKVSYDS
jgi:hypothetical protein